MPGAVAALAPSVDGRTMTRSVLAEVVDAICRSAAERVEVPAAAAATPAPPADVAEAFLARLDGTPFEAPARLGRRARQRPRALGRAGHARKRRPRLVVQLDPPDDGDAWHLSVLGPGARASSSCPVEVALVNAGHQRRELEDQLARLERLLPGAAAARRPCAAARSC